MNENNVIEMKSVEEKKVNTAPLLPLRPLNGGDIAPMLKILNIVGIKQVMALIGDDRMKEIASEFMFNENRYPERPKEVGEDATEEERVAYEYDMAEWEEVVKKINEQRKAGRIDAILSGINMAADVVMLVIANYGALEKDLFDFIGSMTNKDPKEVKALPLDQLAEVIVDIIKRPEFKGFTRVLEKLLAK